MSTTYDNLKSARRYQGLLSISKEEWIKWWLETGKWDERESSHGYIMARIDTTLPFSIDNIFLTTRHELAKLRKK